MGGGGRRNLWRRCNGVAQIVLALVFDEDEKYTVRKTASNLKAYKRLYCVFASFFCVNVMERTVRVVRAQNPFSTNRSNRFYSYVMGNKRLETSEFAILFCEV